MSDELQSLLEKINADGIAKAQEKQAQILADAQKQADAILADAKQQSDSIIADARNEAALLQQKAEQALRQAARDICLTLRQDLQTKVQAATLELLKANLNCERLGAAIAAVITGYMEKNGETDDITALVDEKDLAAIEQGVKASLAAHLQAHTELKPAAGIQGGFKLVFKNSDVMFDFTDQSLTDAIASYVGPKITAILLEND